MDPSPSSCGHKVAARWTDDSAFEVPAAARWADLFTPRFSCSHKVAARWTNRSSLSVLRPQGGYELDWRFSPNPCGHKVAVR